MGKYAVGDAGSGKDPKRSLGDATSYSRSVGKDQMDGTDLDNPKEHIRMGEGNILEAQGRDVSNRSVDVDGWGGEDVPYSGMATETPYGGGAGLKGSATSKAKRG